MSRNDQPWTRRRFLRVGVIGVVGGLVLAAVDEAVILRLFQGSAQASSPAGATPDPRLHFRSRPDLAPHPITVLTAADQVSDGLVFLTPGVDGGQGDGLVMIDNHGEPVWINPLSDLRAFNFKVQRYRGAPVLTWWEGVVVGGHGQGEGVLADTTYREIARVRAAGGLQCDLHEFLITPQDTALITAYAQVPHAAAPGGQPILEGIVQEVDIATGRLLFEWHSYPTVRLAESCAPDPSDRTQPFDYFHVNSIDVDTDGHLLVSARHTWTVYKLHRSTGAILWRLGGKHTDFAAAPAAAFSWQHDARRQPDGTLTVFDDEAPPTPSHGLRLQIDETARGVSLVRAYTHPAPISSDTRGDVQILPNGNVFVGWGGAPFASEFGPAGDLRFDVALWPGELSYRACRYPWRGQPSGSPAAAAEKTSSGGAIVYASWNGATDVQRWQILAGATADGLQIAATAPRGGFETAVTLPSAWPFVAARALDATGVVLGTSPVIQVGA